jgi:hypothetical protein
VPSDQEAWLRLVWLYEELMFLWFLKELTDEQAALIISHEGELSDLKEQLGVKRTAMGTYLLEDKT